MRLSRHLTCGCWLVAACSSSGAAPAPPGDAGADAPVRDAAAFDVSPFDVALPDTSADAQRNDSAGAVDAAASACTLPVELSTMAGCDTCVAESCAPQWCTCAQDPNNTDDAGASGCERYVACVSECVATDAGLPTTCTQTLCAQAPYSTEEQLNGQDLLDCVVLYCSTTCPQ